MGDEWTRLEELLEERWPELARIEGVEGAAVGCSYDDPRPTLRFFLDQNHYESVLERVRRVLDVRTLSARPAPSLADWIRASRSDPMHPLQPFGLLNPAEPPLVPGAGSWLGLEIAGIPWASGSFGCVGRAADGGRLVFSTHHSMVAEIEGAWGDARVVAADGNQRQWVEVGHLVDAHRGRYGPTHLDVSVVRVAPDVVLDEEVSLPDGRALPMRGLPTGRREALVGKVVWMHGARSGVIRRGVVTSIGWRGARGLPGEEQLDYLLIEGPEPLGVPGDSGAAWLVDEGDRLAVVGLHVNGSSVELPPALPEQYSVACPMFAVAERFRADLSGVPRAVHAWESEEYELTREPASLARWYGGAAYRGVPFSVSRDGPLRLVRTLDDRIRYAVAPAEEAYVHDPGRSEDLGRVLPPDAPDAAPLYAWRDADDAVRAVLPLGWCPAASFGWQRAEVFVSVPRSQAFPGPRPS